MPKGKYWKAKNFEEYWRRKFVQPQENPSFVDKLKRRVAYKLYGGAERAEGIGLRKAGELLRTVGMATAYRQNEERTAVRANHMTLRQVAERLSLTKSGELRIASIGSGELTHEVWLHKALSERKIKPRILAVDRSFLMRLKARAERRKMKLSRKDIRIKKGEFLKPKLPEKGLNFIYSLDAFHWLTPKEAEKALDEMKKALDENGKLLITYRPLYWEKEIDLKPGKLMEMMKERGFNVVAHREIYRREREGNKITETIRNLFDGGEEIIPPHKSDLDRGRTYAIYAELR